VKKSGILNRELSRIVASMGHGDYMVISDAGLPLPKNVEVVDVSVSENIPRFLDVLNSVLAELKVEKAIVAKEMKISSSQVFSKVEGLLPGVEIKEISHKEFKKEISPARAVVRTGEFTPYSNIILVSGTVF